MSISRAEHLIAGQLEVICQHDRGFPRIFDEKQNRPIRDGEIQTACQQVCPAGAIVFGNINDPDSRVAQLKAESTNYGVLAELNTHPRTTYLAQVKNPNAALETELPGMEKEEPRALPKVPAKDMSETNSMTHAPR